jgi:hypothetical protein
MMNRVIGFMLLLLSSLQLGCAGFRHDIPGRSFSTPEQQSYCGTKIVRENEQYKIGVVPVDENEVLQRLVRTGNKDLADMILDSKLRRFMGGFVAASFTPVLVLAGMTGGVSGAGWLFVGPAIFFFPAGLYSAFHDWKVEAVLRFNYREEQRCRTVSGGGVGGGV